MLSYIFIWQSKPWKTCRSKEARQTFRSSVDDHRVDASVTQVNQRFPKVLRTGFPVDELRALAQRQLHQLLKTYQI